MSLGRQTKAMASARSRALAAPDMLSMRLGGHACACERVHACAHARPLIMTACHCSWLNAGVRAVCMCACAQGGNQVAVGILFGGWSDSLDVYEE